MIDDPIRIVIADDQPLFSSGLRMQLDAQPDMVCVGIAVDGEHAVRLTERHRPDVVVMDLRMPGMNGLEATRAILAPASAGLSPDPDADSDAPAVIVLTTIRQDEAVFHALQAGASAFLTKDATPADVLGTIRATRAEKAVPAAQQTLEFVRGFAPRTAPPAHQAALTALSPREREVYLLVARGLSNADIAEAVYLSEATVKSHVRAVLAKLALRSRVQVVIHAYENGLISAAR